MEGLDKLENGVDLALQMRNLSLAHGDAREMRDASDGVEIDRHPKLPKHVGKTRWQNTLEREARPYTSPSFGWQTAMRDAHAIGFPLARDAVSRLAHHPVIGRSRQCLIQSQSKICP